MPTVLRSQGFEVMIFTRDHEPIHVHVKHGGESVIINVEDLTMREVFMDRRLVRRALDLVENNREFLISEWWRISPMS